MSESAHIPSAISLPTAGNYLKGKVTVFIVSPSFYVISLLFVAQKLFSQSSFLFQEELFYI